MSIVIMAGIILIAGVLFFIFSINNVSQEPQQDSTVEPEQLQDDDQQEQSTESVVVPPTYDLTTPSSTTFIVNKNRSLPADYIPSDLITPAVKLRLGAGAEQMQFRDAAHDDLKSMFNAAEKDGVKLVFGSGYRSYALQKQFYDGYVARDGVAAADRYSARPGTSEHQTGLSFDATSSTQTCHLEVCFENTAEGKWLAAHAHEYGFILRYPDGKEAITGYQYEPWHFRYLGRDLSIKIKASNQTVEGYFNL